MKTKSPGGEPGLGQEVELLGTTNKYPDPARIAIALIARPIDGARQ
jgi:hypothetical protein